MNCGEQLVYIAYDSVVCLHPLKVLIVPTHKFIKEVKCRTVLLPQLFWCRPNFTSGGKR